MKVGVNECKLERNDIRNVYKSLKEGWYSSSGPEISNFESLWSSYCQRRFGVAVTSGTAGLIMALFSLGLKKGDEVILPNFTIISCGLAIQLTGATMVPVDCDPETLNIDIEKLESSITKKTKAIVIVHIYGQPANMEQIKRISQQHNLIMIEDAAEAHGAEYFSLANGESVWKRCGSEGDISVFSFYANKLITTGEGGMTLTNNEQLHEKLQELRNLGFSPERSYEHKEFGFQFRMTSMQAALGIRQISRMKRILKKKQEMYDHYKMELSDVRELRFLKIETWAKSCHWVTPIILNSKTWDSRNFRKILLEKGIETRPFFVGMHRQPIYKKEKFYNSDSFPNSDLASKNGVILPSGLATTRRQIDFVTATIRQILN